MTALSGNPFENLPPWPQSPESSSRQTLSEATQLCVGCGLCCMGAYLDTGSIKKLEITRLADKKIETHRASDSYRFRMPCSCHIDGHCTIYADRPETCAGYRCSLLKVVMNGSLEGARA